VASTTRGRRRKPADTGRGTGLGPTETIIKGARARKPREREIADHPTISDRIVQNKWVAIVLVAAAGCACQWGKERVVCGRSRKGVAVFVKNLERFVDCFDVMIRADISIVIRRLTTACVAYALECELRHRH